MEQNGTLDPNLRPDDSTVELEIQEEEKKDALESLLNKVDLNAPLEIEDHHGKLVQVPKDKFIEYWMPSGTSQSDAFHCMQAVRATGLNLFAPGECYFFKTGNGPVRLHTGYMAYLRKAYAAGLEHIEKPDIEFGEDPDGYPLSCTIRIKIKDREDMEWTTWFAEVAGAADGGLNSRWKKAPIQMLIKCAIVNILRLSGLVDFTMPYTVDEIDDPTVPGYRTLTQSQLDTHAEPEETEITAGEVNAADHQVDMTPFRKSYFGALKARTILWEDEDRRGWQKEHGLPESTSDWGPADYSKAMDIIHTIPIPNPESESEQTGGDAFLDGLPSEPEDTPESDADDTAPEIPAGESGQQEGTTQDGEQSEKMLPETRKTLTELVKTFPGERYLTIKSQPFKKRAKNVIGRWVQTVTNLTEVEGQNIIASLENEKTAILADEESEADSISGKFAGKEHEAQEEERRQQTEPNVWFSSDEFAGLKDAYMIRVHKKWESPEAMITWQTEHAGIGSFSKWQQEHFDLANAALNAEEAAKGNDESESTTPGEGKCTDDQFAQAKELVRDMPERFHGSIGSEAFRFWAGEELEMKFIGLKMLTEEQAGDLLLAMEDLISTEAASAAEPNTA